MPQYHMKPNIKLCNLSATQCSAGQRIATQYNAMDNKVQQNTTFSFLYLFQ